MSTSFQPSRLLRFALLGDAVASGATGLLMAAASGPLSGLLGLPQQLLLYAGLFLLPYAAFVGYVGTRAIVSRGAVWTIVVANALWVVESIALLVSGWGGPTTLGYAFVVFQAVVVLAFAELQFMGLRKAPRATALPA